jgi:hypothetical protein
VPSKDLECNEVDGLAVDCDLRCELTLTPLVGLVMLLHGHVRSRIDEALMAICPSHVVGRGAFVATHLEDLGLSWRLTNTVTADQQPIAGFGMHCSPPMCLVR